MKKVTQIALFLSTLFFVTAANAFYAYAFSGVSNIAAGYTTTSYSGSPTFYISVQSTTPGVNVAIEIEYDTYSGHYYVMQNTGGVSFSASQGISDGTLDVFGLPAGSYQVSIGGSVAHINNAYAWGY